MTSRSLATVRQVALVYVRVSRLDLEERERKLSPAMQRERAVALPELQGLAVEFSEDLDVSGKDAAHRPQYLALLRRLERGDVRYVVAYDLSRITRNLADQAAFFEALRAQRVEFLDSSKARTIDLEDEDEELVANVEGAVNQHARKKTARRVRDTLATKVAHGELVGPPPAGLVRRREISPSGKVTRTWIEPDSEPLQGRDRLWTRPEIIARLFRDYATGRYSFSSLAQELNAEGVPPVRPPHFRNNRLSAEIWTADVLKDLLANPRYKGLIPRRDGTLHRANYVPFVDEATWDACQQARRANAARRGLPPHGLGRGQRGPWKSAYALTALARCAGCGAPMRGESRSPDRTHRANRAFYTCFRRRHTRDCTMPVVPAAPVEAEVVEILSAVSLPDGFTELVDSLGEVPVMMSESSRLAAIRSLDERIRRLQDLYEHEHLSAEDYYARHAELSAQIRELSLVDEQPTLAERRGELRSLVQVWPEATPDERRRLLTSIFETIEIGENGFVSARLREGWRDFVETVLRLYQERKTGLEPPSNTFEAAGIRFRLAA